MAISSTSARRSRTYGCNEGFPSNEGTVHRSIRHGGIFQTHHILLWLKSSSHFLFFTFDVQVWKFSKLPAPPSAGNSSGIY